MKWLRRIAIALGLLVLLFVAIPCGVGSLRAREHSATGSVIVDAPIELVWKSITDFEAMPHWAPDVGKMQRLPDVDGKPQFKETRDDFTLHFSFDEMVEPTRLVVHLEDDSGYFGGTWTYVLAAEDGRTRVTITENGWTEPAFFRFMLLLFGTDSTIKHYLEALQQRHAGSHA
jgi:uncharacterized protein YndB with AHSA1/START domain